MSRLCRLRNASHGDDGQWAYSEIVGLREQVEKLTEERDAAWSVNPTVSENLLREQLAALAEQNEKMREACEFAAERFDHPDNADRMLVALSLPDLASPVLNRIRAEENEAIIAAANALENIASTSSSTRIRRVANEALTAIRARRK